MLKIIENANGDNIDCSSSSGISFDLRRLINGKELVFRFAWFLWDLEFSLIDVLQNGESRKEQYEKESLVSNELYNLNRLFKNELEHARLGNKEQIKKNL